MTKSKGSPVDSKRQSWDFEAEPGSPAACNPVPSSPEMPPSFQSEASESCTDYEHENDKSRKVRL